MCQHKKLGFIFILFVKKFFESLFIYLNETILDSISILFSFGAEIIFMSPTW